MLGPIEPELGCFFEDLEGLDQDHQDPQELEDLQDHQDLVQKQKSRKEKTLSSLLLCIDDLSDDPNLKLRGESLLSKLFCTGRHMGISVWLNCHSLNSCGPLLRKNASTLVVFKISNS